MERFAWGQIELATSDVCMARLTVSAQRETPGTEMCATATLDGEASLKINEGCSAFWTCVGENVCDHVAANAVDNDRQAARGGGGRIGSALLGSLRLNKVLKHKYQRHAEGLRASCRTWNSITRFWDTMKRSNT